MGLDDWEEGPAYASGQEDDYEGIDDLEALREGPFIPATNSALEKQREEGHEFIPPADHQERVRLLWEKEQQELRTQVVPTSQQPFHLRPEDLFSQFPPEKYSSTRHDQKLDMSPKLHYR